MQRKDKRKLELNRETIRALNSREMARIAGGGKTFDTWFACPGGGTQGCPKPTVICTFFPKAKA